MTTSRRRFLRQSAQQGVAALSVASLLPSVAQALSTSPLPDAADLVAASSKLLKPDHVVRSLPENMVWGYFGADVPPVSRVKDGSVVEIQTVNPSGVSRTDPEAFYKPIT